jgi:hypothetical protein
MQKIADHQDYQIPATIDDASIMLEIAEALGEAKPHPKRPEPNDVGVPASAGPDDRIPPEGGTPTRVGHPKSAADRSKG